MVVATYDTLNQTVPRIMTVLLEASDTYNWDHEQRPVRLRDIRLSAVIDPCQPYDLHMNVHVENAGWQHTLATVNEANPNLPRTELVNLTDDIPVTTTGSIMHDIFSGTEILEKFDRWKGCLTLMNSQPLQMVNANSLFGMEVVIIYDYP